MNLTQLIKRPPWKRQRSVLWTILIILVVAAQSLLVVLTINYEESKAQEHVDESAAALFTQLQTQFNNEIRSIQTLTWSSQDPDAWFTQAQSYVDHSSMLLTLEYRNHAFELMSIASAPNTIPGHKWESFRLGYHEITRACQTAKQLEKPVFTPTHFSPHFGEIGLEILEFCIAAANKGEVTYVVGIVGLENLLRKTIAINYLQNHEISFVDSDGARLARAGNHRGKGIFTSRQLLTLEGANLEIKVDSTSSRPSLIPNLSVALVIGLSASLFGVVVLLLRDTRKRSHIQRELAQSLAFRKAMENSLGTGLRARDLDGKITYANPAFCHMVGYSFEELLRFSQEGVDPPYWPRERIQDYHTRQQQRHQLMELDLTPKTPIATSFQGFETEFIRSNGETFPVMIYESPLLDHQDQHTGWMSAVVDISEQRKMEDQTRQQQERLQSISRLVTIGEMASLLSHELNQPLAAISSYAHGSLNLVQDEEYPAISMLKDAIQAIASNADRAGKVIRSVHDFVRRREKSHELVTIESLAQSVMPLINLQARKTRSNVEWIIDNPLIHVKADRIMIEQVLLNLARNGIQAMENLSANDIRSLSIRMVPVEDDRIKFSFTDTGIGISPEVASHLYTPFFTTRTEGMGMGLSLCRTVIEQHGGSLEFKSLEPQKGCSFWFTLPIANYQSPA